MPSRPTTKVEADVDYPISDGKPMVESPVHRDNMIAMIDVLRTRYRDDPNVYVSGKCSLRRRLSHG